MPNPNLQNQNNFNLVYKREDSRYDCFPVEDQDTHYKKEVQPIDLIDAFNLDFNVGNVIKYVARAKHKENELEDLRKAKYYLDRLYEKAKASKSWNARNPWTMGRCLPRGDIQACSKRVEDKTT